MQVSVSLEALRRKDAAYNKIGENARKCSSMITEKLVVVVVASFDVQLVCGHTLCVYFFWADNATENCVPELLTIKLENTN